jgi:DNA-binding CsgD family transcriptional regulator
LLAGNASYSESLLGQARPHLVDPIEIAQAQRLDGDLRYGLGEPHLGPSLLIGAARAFEPLDRVLSHYALLDAFVAVTSSGHVTQGTTRVEIAQTALDSLGAQTTQPTAADILLKGVALRYSRNYADAVPVMQEALRAQPRMSPEQINRWSQLGSQMANDLWDEAMLLDIVDRLEGAARAQGALSTLQVALLALEQIDLRSGRFGLARERHSELHDVTMTIGGYVEIYDLLDVELLGCQGDGRTPARAAELREGGIALHAQALVYLADQGLSIFALGEGQYDAALAAARSVVDADTAGFACQTLPFVVEAGMRCGDRDAASGALALLAERATASGTPWALGLLARCRALVANSSAGELYAEALDQLSKTSWLREVAHTHLLYGEWLRRKKLRIEAREHLRRAHEMFDSMGAMGFAERARVELLATGERARSRRAETSHNLTPRELQIARLAAKRATSPEIAAQLFISANTVDYHLRKVYQKFGISSRREIVGLLPDEAGQLA